MPCWLETWRVWPRAISSSPLPLLICTTQALGDKATTKGFEVGVTDSTRDKALFIIQLWRDRLIQLKPGNALL